MAAQKFTHYSSGSRSWSGDEHWHADAGEPMHQALLAAYGDDYLVRVPTGHGRRIWKLPGVEVYYELTTANSTFQLAVGSGVAGGELVNRQVVPYFKNGVGPSVTTSLAFRLLGWFAPEGFLVGYAFGNITQSNYHMTQLYSVSTLLDAENNSETDRVAVARTLLGSGTNSGNEQRLGRWTRALIYDQSQAGFTDAVNCQTPFMALNNFVKSVDGSASVLYGVKTYSPVPPYPELGLFRVYGADRFGEGALVTEGLRQYRTFDQNDNFWVYLSHCLPYMPWYGETGLLGLNWS